MIRHLNWRDLLCIKVILGLQVHFLEGLLIVVILLDYSLSIDFLDRLYTHLKHLLKELHIFWRDAGLIALHVALHHALLRQWEIKIIGIIIVHQLLDLLHLLHLRNVLGITIAFVS